MENIKYYDMSLIDTHMHVNQSDCNISEIVNIYKKKMHDYNYEKIVVSALPYVETRKKARDFLQNLKTFYVKHELSTSCYALAGLSHSAYKEKNTAEFFLKQAQFYDAAGFDGFKMEEGRINEYMVCGVALDDESYDLFYDYAEDRGLPILMHVGAPEEFYDNGTIENTWKGAPTLFELYAQIDNILAKHPKLKLILAHFYFVTKHIEKAEEMLTKWENVYFDLTPSIFMYYDFQKSPDDWTDFFIRNKKKILFGTDIGFSDANTVGKFKDAQMYLPRRFFECTKEFEVFDEILMPMPLDKEILSYIYRENALLLYGDAPKPINKEKMAEEIKALEDFKILLSPDDIENLTIIKNIFQ